uniref:Uncharacterized protein n=1 Tax=Onchocerca volvulus TaxID=6282 RepID=A0A8R1TQ46_ONCVO
RTSFETTTQSILKKKTNEFEVKLKFSSSIRFLLKILKSVVKQCYSKILLLQKASRHSNYRDITRIRILNDPSRHEERSLKISSSYTNDTKNKGKTLSHLPQLPWKWKKINESLNSFEPILED